VKITFHGGVREVGGSCITVETGDARVALDYGIKVGEKLPEDLPKNLDLVAISHAHLDHAGGLLTLAGTNVVIVGSEATRDIAADLLLDLIKVQRMNGYEVPYGYHDISKLRRMWWPRERVALPGMEVQLHPAGHVLGARMIELRAEGKTVLYTGDFCLHDTEILEGCRPEELPKRPDVLIMETTYGGKLRPPRSILVHKLLEKIVETIEREGNVLIPAFAFHRSQEISRRIDQAMQSGEIPKYNAYTISKLAQKITRHFRRYRRLLSRHVQDEDEDPFRYRYVKQLSRMRQMKEPAIAICTSGFGHAGVSYRLLLGWAPDEDNSILISTGYVPPESPLVMAKEKGEIINNGVRIPVRAKVEQIELSGHADQSELIQLVKTLKPKRTILVHGETEQAKALAEKILHLTQVDIPEKGDTLTI